MRARWVALLLVAACGTRAKPALGPSPSAPAEASRWELPDTEADMASRRVRGSRVAHIDEAVREPIGAFHKQPPALTGDAAERTLPTAHSLRVEAGRCYRLSLQADASLQALAVVVQDADGGTVVDASTDLVPSRGALCADQSAELTVKVSAGLGHGHYALELWALERAR